MQGQLAEAEVPLLGLHALSGPLLLGPYILALEPPHVPSMAAYVPSTVPDSHLPHVDPPAPALKLLPWRSWSSYCPLLSPSATCLI